MKREEGVDGTIYEDGRQVSPRPRRPRRTDWASLRALLAKHQRVWTCVSFTTVEREWDPIGLEALGFVKDANGPELGAWTYHFDRTPPDPNG